MSLVTASLESNALPKRASSASRLCGGTLPKDWLSLDESASDQPLFCIWDYL